MGRIAIVVGGTGMAACELAPHLIDDFEGEDAFEKVAVLALGVNEETFAGKTKRKITPLIGANLNDAESIAKSMKKMGVAKATHVYWFLDANRPPKIASPTTVRHLMNVGEVFGGVTKGVLDVMPESARNKFYEKLTTMAGSGPNPRNIMWLDNMFAALRDCKAPLENFTLGTGGKHYGMHIGPFLWSGYQTPFEEDKHRSPGPLSYFDMQNYVEEKAKEEGFTWNVMRPTFIIGLSPEKTNTTQSFGLVLAVYANLLKAQGHPLYFPGNRKAWNARIQLSTSKKIAQVAAWASTGSTAGLRKEVMKHNKRSSESKRRSSRRLVADPDPEAVENQAFNIVSCDEFCWGEVWEDIAEYFGMESGGEPTKAAGFNCMDMLGGLLGGEKTWHEVVRKYKLKFHSFQEVFNADFLDKSFTATWDSQFSTKKLKKAGYPKSLIYEGGSPQAIMIEFFDGLVDAGVIPDPAITSSGSSKRLSARSGSSISASSSNSE